MLSKNTRHLAYASLLTNTIIWGAALPIVKPALSHTSPFDFLFFRYLIGALLVTPLLVYFLIKLKPQLKTLLTIISLEFLVLVFGHSLLYAGLNLTSSLEASLIGISSPIFITIGGVLFLKEIEERHELIGLIIAVAGTVIITLEPLLNGHKSLFSGSFLGNLLVLGYVFTWTIYNLLAKRLYKKITNKFLITSVGLWIGTLGMLPLIWLTQNISHPAQIISLTTNSLQIPSVLLASLYMGFLGTVVAIPAYIFGLSKIEASEASLFSYLQPLISIPLAILWLKEDLKPSALIGLVFIFIGVFIAERRPASKPTTPI